MKLNKSIALLLALFICLGMCSTGFAKVETEIADPIFHNLCDSLLGKVGAADDEALLGHVKTTVRSMFHTGILTRAQANSIYNTCAKLKEAEYKDYDAMYKDLCKLAGALEQNEIDFENNTVNVTAYIMDRLDAARLENARYASGMVAGNNPSANSLKNVLFTSLADNFDADEEVVESLIEEAKDALNDAKDKILG